MFISMIKNRKKRYAAVGVVLLLTALLMALCTACGGTEDTPERIEVSGYRDNFFVGDSFETGSDFKVEAIWADGTRTDVTAEAVVTQEKGMDMNVSGDYMITVSFGGKKCVYTVYVSSSEPTLQKLTADVSNAKTAFSLGDTFSTEGLKLVATYRNEQGALSEQTVTSLAGYTITVTDPNGRTATGGFSDVGTYTVTVAKGETSTSFAITVGVDLSTVRGAVLAAIYGRAAVNGGNMSITDTIKGSVTSNFTYTFGDNYTYISTGGGERHYSLDENGTLVPVVLEGGSIIPDATSLPEAMNGVPIGLWWHENTEYGIEAAIRNMYDRAADDLNGDYTDTVDAADRTYSFSFGYVMERITGVDGDDYFFVNTVTFTLDENCAVVSATLSQTQYINYASQPEAPNYVTDEAGHATLSPTAEQSSRVDIAATQTVGERTAVNPYGKDRLTVDSFELMYDGKPLGEEDVIYGNAGMDITIRITNILPETADLTVDALFYSDGIGKAEQTIFVGTGFTAHRNTGKPNIINVHLSNGGEWELVLSTEKFTRRVKLSVTGAPPTSLTTEVYRAAFGSFSKGEKVTSMVGSTVYFRANPNQYANDAYTVAVAEGDASAVTLTETEINGVKCWSFTASAAGKYDLLMTSTTAKDVTCRLSLDVVDIPDLGEMLNGVYTVTDTEGNVYRLTFERETSGETVSGNLTILYTPADGQAVTQTLKYTANGSDLTLTLEAVSGDELGVSLKVNSEGKLVLEDRYGVIYAPER